MCIGMANGGKTPKEMTPQEALNKLDETVIGNLEWKIVLSNALEKQIPKKPNEYKEFEDGTFYNIDFMCPTCNNAVFGQPYKPNYCKHCGQKIDWSDTE